MYIFDLESQLMVTPTVLCAKLIENRSEILVTIALTDSLIRSMDPSQYGVRFSTNGTFGLWGSQNEFINRFHAHVFEIYSKL